jgi:hypothetical protein
MKYDGLHVPAVDERIGWHAQCVSGKAMRNDSKLANVAAGACLRTYVISHIVAASL